MEQALGKDLMTEFMKSLKKYVKKIVLNRQDRYANNVQIENEKNLNYFYEDKLQKLSPSRKLNLDKINRKIDEPNNLSINLRKLPEKTDEFPPHYTTFNFHKMRSIDRYDKPYEVNHKSFVEGKRDR